jgi:uncharacterized protein DUF6073
MSESSNGARQLFGRPVAIRGLRNLYAPQRVKKFTPPPAGIDNLELTSHDTFVIPGRGEFTVDFKGYFRVARANPTTKDWATADIHVQMVDMRLEGHSREIGNMRVRLNPDFVSAGQTFAPGSAKAAAACRIATAAVFSLPDQKLEVFNKEPVLLMNDAIESVPPVEDPRGEAHIYRLPLYDVNHPDAHPVAYLTRLRYTVGNYLSEAQVRELHTRLG